MRGSVLWLTVVGCHDYGLYRPLSAVPGEWDPSEAVEARGQTPYTPVREARVVSGGQADLLFFGDTSGSMVAELETLGEEAASFVATLEDYTVDWQLLAVTGPDGCGNNGVLSRADPDFAALFAEGLTMPPGEDDVDEWGLYNALEAIRNSEPGGCNADFLRTGATLQVVFISDEDDNSPGWQDGDPDYWQPYTDEIRWHHAADQPVIFSAIAGPDPGGCSGAEPGVGYWQAAAAAGGAQLSICDDWSSQLDLLARLSAMQKWFTLDATPIPWTLSVQVDGEERLGGWAYVAEQNRIRFDIDPPLGGQEVVIEYLVRALPE